MKDLEEPKQKESDKPKKSGSIGSTSLNVFSGYTPLMSGTRFPLLISS